MGRAGSSVDEPREHRTSATAVHWLRCTAAVLVVGLAGTACASHSNTTQASPAEPTTDPSVPTTSIVRSRATTTTIGPRPAVADVGTDPTSQLTAVLGQLAAAPELAAQLGGLDTAGIAGLLGLDPGVLAALGLSPAQLQQLAVGVLAAPAATQAQLVGGSIDPQALLGILAGSLDLEGLAGGAVSDVVAGLLAALGGIVLSPELVINLDRLIDQLDLDELDPIAADPANAALLALVTSAWLSSNPLLAEQLLASPLLDPILKELLEQLRLISDTLGETSRNALLELLYSLVPGLRPPAT